jgi:hypothetical protein
MPCLAPLAIVKRINVLGDLAPGLLPCRVTSVVDQLVLQRPPEALDRRIDVTIPAAAHRCPHAELRHQRTILV